MNNKPPERTLEKSNKDTPKDLDPKVNKKVRRNLIKKNLTRNPMKERSDKNLNLENLNKETPTLDNLPRLPVPKLMLKMLTLSPPSDENP